jgi:hypothetical protein
MNETLNATVEAKKMQRELLANAMDSNNVITTAENVGPMFLAPYFNMTDGDGGIERLIMEILTDNGSVFPSDIASTEFRQVAINGSMYASEIIQAVQDRFAAGSTGYPYATVYAYLCNKENKKKSGILAIKLTNSEDKPRPCPKPRQKYFLPNA